MPGAATDRRVLRTRKRLTKALISLTLEKGYEAVSIRDITESAGVGYATFFRHFADKEALLAEVLDTFLDDLLGLLAPISVPKDPVETGRLVFEHARQNSELYNVLLKSGSNKLLDRVYEVGTQGILTSMRPKRGGLLPPEAAANHVIASFLALLRWWLAAGMPCSAERMGEIYSELIIGPARRLAFEG